MTPDEERAIRERLAAIDERLDRLEQHIKALDSRTIGLQRIGPGTRNPPLNVDADPDNLRRQR